MGASEVDGQLKGFLSDFPTVIGYVVMNGDGIPVKHTDSMAYSRAVMISALMTDFISNCKKCLKELLQSPAESELSNVRIRTKEGTEIIGVQFGEYTFVVVQNCTFKDWANPEEEGAAAGG